MYLGPQRTSETTPKKRRTPVVGNDNKIANALVMVAGAIFVVGLFKGLFYLADNANHGVAFLNALRIWVEAFIKSLLLFAGAEVIVLLDGILKKLRAE